MTEHKPSDRCDHCGATIGLVHYHQETSYVEASRNWVTLCPPCKVDNDDYWRERWAEYNAGRL